MHVCTVNEETNSGNWERDVDGVLKQFMRETRKDACVEIISAVQDVIFVFKSECDKMARKQGLTNVLEKVPKRRYGYARHFCSSADEIDVVIFELKAFVRIFESAQCLEEDLAYRRRLPSAIKALV